MGLLDAEEQDESAYCGPEVDNQDAKALYSEEMPSAAVEETSVSGEKAGEDSTEDTAYSVYGRCAYRVVDMQLVVDEFDGENEDAAAEQTYDCSAPRRHHVASCGDAYESGQHAVEGQRKRGLTVLEPGEEHSSGSAGSRRQVGGQEDVRDGGAVHFSAGGQLAAGVESEPSEPEDEYAECREGKVVSGDGPALAVLAVFAATRSERQRSDQCQHSADTMHDGAAREIVEAKAGEPSASPGPMPLDRVDDKGDECAVDQVHGEFGPFRHGAADDGRGCGAEDRLEDKESFAGKVALVE